jgi:hypothetical protein
MAGLTFARAEDLGSPPLQLKKKTQSNSVVNNKQVDGKRLFPGAAGAEPDFATLF